jgi:hypothetical protein
MRVSKILSLAIALAFVTTSFFTNASGGEPPELIKALQKEWKVVSRTVGGKVDNRFEGATLSILESDKADLKSKTGELTSIKLAPKVHDEKTKTIRFVIELPDDSLSWGGGGPRKGICRINDKGDLEMIEAQSASGDFPIDFSDEVKAKSIYLKMAQEEKK